MKCGNILMSRWQGKLICHLKKGHKGAHEAPPVVRWGNDESTKDD